MKEETCTAAQELLRSYRLCAEMLYLRRYEKKRAAEAGDDATKPRHAAPWTTSCSWTAISTRKGR